MLCDDLKGRQHIKKQRHYFAAKVHLAKAMVFPVVMYGCECWTVKKTEHQTIDAFELWCWSSARSQHERSHLGQGHVEVT